jgi:hypothetical protein
MVSFGLVATGTSGRWEVAIDEAIDRDEWYIEIEGPHTYLTFQLRDLQAVPDAWRFLHSRLERAEQHSPRGNPGDDKLTLGQFGSTLVSLLWDNEDFPRCFVVVLPEEGSALRVTLEAEDIRKLIEALQQVVTDLPKTACE